jgi:thioesterase domain-containing protein
MAWIAAELGPDLPVSTLFRHSTVRKLAAVLRQDASADEHPTLVPIQPAGEGTPFFCVHPVGGTVFCYSDLARCLGEDRPFFGLQSSPPLEGAPLPTLEELAREYLRSVREAQPAGPYLLGGWSMGAAVAFEMARQLRAEGEEVASLALIDPSPLSGPGVIRAKDDESLALFFAQDLAGLMGGPLPSALWESGGSAAGVLPRLYEAMHAAGLLPGALDLAGLERLFTMFKSNGLALQGYSPSPQAPYDGPVTIFLADAPRPFDPTLSWRPLMIGAPDVQRCSGNHHTMLKPPHVQALATKLGVALRRRVERRE